MSWQETVTVPSQTAEDRLSIDIVICIYNNATVEALREVLTSPVKADIPVVFAPVLGWWTAMWAMLRMEGTQRRALLGCAVARHSSKLDNK